MLDLLDMYSLVRLRWTREARTRAQNSDDKLSVSELKGMHHFDNLSLAPARGGNVFSGDDEDPKLAELSQAFYELLMEPSFHGLGHSSFACSALVRFALQVLCHVNYCGAHDDMLATTAVGPLQYSSFLEETDGRAITRDRSK